MKILSIKIENIASLKGTHQINFEDIFEQSGVFAITGETGSGKSTILNCISLALYGQHYKKNNKQLDFITLGERHGEIELIYSANNQIYKAYWFYRIKKNDGTNLKKPSAERLFYKKNHENWIAIDETPENTLNLSFDQFTKTIVLNQGEFAKFLTSNFKDRKDILSKLYDGEKLDNLSQNVRRKINHYKTQCDLLLSQIKGINENTDFDIKEAKYILNQDLSNKSILIKLQDSLINNQKKLNDLSNIYQTWQKNIKSFKSATTTLSQITDKLNSSKYELEKTTKEHKANKEKLESNRKHLIESITKMKFINEQKKDLLETQNNLIKLQTSLKSKKERLHDLKLSEEKLHEMINKSKESQLYCKVDSNINDKFIEDTQRIIKNFNEVTILKTRLDLLTKQKKELEGKIQASNKKINNQDKQYTNDDYDSLENDLRQLSQRVKHSEYNLKDVETLLSEKTKTEDEKKKYKNMLKNINKDINKNNVTLDDLKMSVDEISLAIKSFDLEEKINTISHESIAEGKCLICHSENLDAVITNDHLIDKKTNLSNRLKKKSNELKVIELNIESLRSTQAHYRAHLEKIKQDQLFLQNKYSSILQNHENASIKYINEELVKKLNKQHSQLKQIYQENEQQLKQYLEKLNQINSEKITKNNLEKDYRIIKAEINELLNHIDSYNSKFTAYNNYYKDLFNENIEYSKLNLVLDHLHRHNKYENERISIQNSIQQNKQMQDEVLIELANKEKHQTLLKDQINNDTKIIQIYSPSLDPQGDLDILRSNVERSSKQLENKNADHGKLLIQIAENESKLKSYKEQYEQSQVLFDDIANQLTQTALTAVSHCTLENTYKDLSNKAYRYFQSFKTAPKIERLEELVLNETINHCDEINKTFQTTLVDLTQSITKTKLLIDQKEQAQIKIKDIESKLDSLKLKQKDLEDLYELVGKDEFRNFVLALIEKNLINQTNYELKNLCDDRYIIQHFNKYNKAAPDFYIVDKFKAGLTRKVSTLSGGETFMVSLAMAMALAELTRGTSEIDSFFIDEGFGTLDEDSLEDVLDMIHNMEQRGKSIGLISHVKNLTNRIDINVKLNKSSLGNSNITIEYN